MPQRTKIRIGTRKSRLALAQAEQVQLLIMSEFPDVVVDLVPMNTTGDEQLNRSLSEIGGKGLFTKELEEAMHSGAVDMAVHSLKDMETKLKDGLVIGATLARADARDALISPVYKTLAALPSGATIGTSSLRRAALVRIQRPDITIVPFRGNIETRLAKLGRGEVDATLLAVAGLARIGLTHEITEILDETTFIPAVGQGIIAIECREQHSIIREILHRINHPQTWSASVAERSLLAMLDGSCRTPIAAYATVDNAQLHLRAVVAKPDGSFYLRAERSGQVEDAAQIGQMLAEELLLRGAKACIA